VLIEPGTSDKLFCYGTLVFAGVMRAVTGGDHPSRSAVLRGYARYRVRGEPFPGIVEQPGAEVHGVLYHGVDATALNLIDVYEHECYARRLLEVDTGDGSAARAWVYVVPPAMRARLGRRDWDRDAFARRHLGAWLRALGA
jgi:gamma-glutamylcyclotransferase (GGCT)/AIG2-like uncharacterized protein YtfP